MKVSQNGLGRGQGCAEVFGRTLELRQPEESVAISGICAQDRTELLPCLRRLPRQPLDLAQAKVSVDQPGLQAQRSVKTFRGIRVPLLSSAHHPQSGPTLGPGGGVANRQSRFLFGAYQIARTHHFESLLDMI
jgi:hypothetical protein